MRIACVHVPDFAVWVLRRKDPALNGKPIVIGGSSRGTDTVVARSVEARKLGVRLGMTITSAQSLAPRATFVPLDGARVRRAERTLTEKLETLSPAVERAAHTRGLFFIDLHGLDRLISFWDTRRARDRDRVSIETVFAHRARAKARRLGLPAAIGVASSKLVARIATIEAKGGVRVITAGQEQTFLAPLPLERLPLDQDLFAQLDALGIATIGEWSRLPPETIAARFGPHGARLHALARGERVDPFARTDSLPALEISADLDEPLDDVRPLAFHFKRALDQLCAQLAERGVATTGVRASLRLEGHGQHECEARFVRPTLAAPLILDCLRLALARERLPARVVGFTLTALDTTCARAEQLQLFARRGARDPATVERTLARVRALLGPESVVTPQPADAHRPERQIAWTPYERPIDDRPPVLALARVHPQAAPPPGPALRHLPTRLLDKPLTAQVRLARGQPVHLAAGLAHGAVVASHGPHRITGSWWDATFGRDYYTLTLTGGDQYWVYRQHEKGRWFLHGVYD